jgi:hypothetical protein
MPGAMEETGRRSHAFMKAKQRLECFSALSDNESFGRDQSSSCPRNKNGPCQNGYRIGLNLNGSV